MPSVVEQFSAYGHPHVAATHRSTFEITKEEDLSSAGTCILAVRSEKGAADLSPEFRDLLRTPGSRLLTQLSCGGIRVTISSVGSPDLLLSHTTDLVWRRSSFTCGRTIGLYCDQTARTLPRELIRLLQAGEQIDIVLTVMSDASHQHHDNGVGLFWLKLSEGEE